jgi:hypothetical protein
MLSLIFGYIKLYLEKGSGNFQLQDIFEMMKASFIKMLLTMMLVFVIVMVGLVLCVIPGIYPGVSLSIIFGRNFFHANVTIFVLQKSLRGIILLLRGLQQYKANGDIPYQSCLSVYSPDQHTPPSIVRPVLCGR